MSPLAQVITAIIVIVVFMVVCFVIGMAAGKIARGDWDEYL